jgi:NAD(P)-dependent dehydrogenase (short-subunit alcohol dehydrogenase family)
VTTKDKISSDYLSETKRQYLEGVAYVPTRRKILILGWDNGNIAEGIELAIREAYPTADVACYAYHQLRAQALEGLESLATFDTIVFANGETHLDWIEDQPWDKIHSVLLNSLEASMQGTSQFVRHTLNAPYRKNIVYIGSMAYNHVLNGSAPYCAAKAGLAMFARCMAWELAPKNYDVFCIHPSNTEGTPMTQATIEGLQRYRGLSRAQATSYWAASLPKDRWLNRMDIGHVVAELIDGQHQYLSGSPIELAGGQR